MVNPPKQKFKLEKQDEDIKTISNSLYHACCIKYQDKSLTIDKEKLIYQIVDNCHVTPTKAKEYLNILMARGIIDFDRELVYYKVKEDEKLSQKISDEINKVLNK